MEESKISKRLKRVMPLMRFYGPYLGAGVKVKEFNEDLTQITVQMKLSWFNRNLYGTQFGGSLYSMVDPFFMFMLLNALGDDYIVWDKNASIDFVKPGKSTVFAKMEITKEQTENIKKELEEIGKNVYFFDVSIFDTQGELISTVKKGVYVRKKK